MQYRSMEQIAAEADIVSAADLSRRERLERWAEVLEQRPGRLRAIPDVEFGPRRERDARRADDSPLAVAYADPVLRAAGLKGDRIGDAIEFFGLSHEQLHRLVCFCHHGRTIAPSGAAAHVRLFARRAGALRISTTGPIVAAAGGALLAAVALALSLF